MAPEPPEQSQQIAAAISDVSDRMTLLVREEIELAKAEVSAKVSKLVKGAIVGAAAGVFVLLALLFGLHGVAWLLYYALPVNNNSFFWGFFVLAAILLIIGALAGLFAYKKVRAGTPPTPQMAIDEAKKIRTTVTTSGAAPRDGR